MRSLLGISASAVALLLLFATANGACAQGVNERRDDIDQRALFRAVGGMYGIDPDLLEAVAIVESSGRPDAVSPKGAVGLMQLMPGTAARFGVRDPRDPVANALGAARYIAWLRRTDLGGGDESLWRILAAYNAGEGLAWRYSGLPPVPETRECVGRVLWAYLIGTLPPARTAGRPARQLHESRARGPEPTALEELQAIRRARESADLSPPMNPKTGR